MLIDFDNLMINILIVAVLILFNGMVVIMNTAMTNINLNNFAGEDKADQDIIRITDKKLMEILENQVKYRYANRVISYFLILTGLLFSLNIKKSFYISALIYFVILASVGELLPRKIAIQHSNYFLVKFSNLQKVISFILTPVVLILSIVPDILLKIFRQETKVEIKSYSEEQIISLLETGRQRGEIKEEGKKMITSIFHFDDELANEIMTPRTDVFLIDKNDPPEQYIDKLMELRYSRIPVCEGEPDNIIGILHIKDYLIKARDEGFEKVDITKILRKPYLVPETKNIDSLFYEMQRMKQHIAILIDEYGGFSGIVTMEDIIEEVMGEIDDEYDKDEFMAKKADEKTYYINGKSDLGDLNEEFHLNLESETSETIGGLICDLLGEIPGEDDIGREITYKNFVFTVLSVNERRIDRVKLEIRDDDKAEDDEESA